MIKVIKEYLKVLSENPGIIKKNDQEMPGFEIITIITIIIY